MLDTTTPENGKVVDVTEAINQHKKQTPQEDPQESKKRQLDVIQEGINKAVCLVNKTFYRVIIDGQARALRMIPANTGTGLRAEFFKKEDLNDFYSKHNKVLVGYTQNGVEQRKNPARIWWENKKGQHCTGSIDFNPSEPPLQTTSKDTFNLWQGWTVKPQKKELVEYASDPDLQLYLNHVHDVICAGNREHSNYLIQYIAHMFQKPEEKPSVAVVLKAGQGVGKGTFMEPLKKIAGGHALATTSAKDVVGRFNAVLEAKILVFFDEAFANQKEAAGTLKGLISETYTRVERKNVNATSIPNYMRLFMASNADNIVQVEADDRRYFFLKCSEHVKQDTEHFSRIWKALNKPDFPERLLGYLLSVDISSFNPRTAPKTDELMRQKLDSMEPEYKWLYNVLSRGQFASGATWPERMPSEDCYTKCIEWLDINKIPRPYGEPENKIGLALTRAGIKRKRTRTANGREYIRIFPSLEDARKNFSVSMNGEISW